MGLPDLRLTSAAFRDGDLSESSAGLLVGARTAATADVFDRDEEMLVGWATTLPYADFKQVIDRWKTHAMPDEADGDRQEAFDRRRLHISPILDGVHAIDGLLDADGAGLVTKALRAMSSRTELDGRTLAQSRADGLVAMADFVLKHLEPAPGAKRARHKVIATATLDDMINAHGGGVIDYDTTSVVTSIGRVRALACDCELHRLILGPDSRPIDYGRQQRTVPDHLFDLLVARDHGCRFPGCTVPATGCDVHHLVHWLNGGETKLDNLALHCWYHHHLIHDQHWSTKPLGAGHYQLIDPTGHTHMCRPPLLGTAVPTQP